MNAKVKCSNCGAEITNLTFSWGKKQWLWMLLAFLPMIGFILWFERPRGDFAKELKTSLLDARFLKDEVVVLGKVSNLGKHKWQSVTVEAEFYGKDGRFLDEASHSLSASLRPGSEENFRITLRKPSEEVMTNSPKVTLKVADASNYPF